MRRALPVLLVVVVLALWAGVLALGSWIAGAPASEVAGDHPLASAGYAFCHREGFDGMSARAFCDLLDDAPDDLCPGMRATCDGTAEPFEPAAGCAGSAAPSGSVAGDPDRPLDRGAPELGWLERVVAWLPWLAAAFVAVVLVAVARVLVPLLWRRRLTGPERAPAAEAAPLSAAAPVPSTMRDPLEEARRALDAGDVERAVFVARDVAVSHLVGSGRLPDRPWDTDRARVRRLQPLDDRQHLGLLIRAVERARWAGLRISDDLARRAVDAAARLLALCLLLLPMAAQAWERHGALGDSALHALWEAEGHDVRSVNGPLAELTREQGDVLFIGLLGVQPSTEDWAAVFSFAEQGGSVVIAGHHPGMSERFGRRAPRLAAELPLVATEHYAPLGLPIPRWSPAPDEVFCGDAVVPWVVPADPVPECDGAYVVGARDMGVGLVVVVSDARLLANASLVSDANRDLLRRLPRTLMGWAEDETSGLRVRLALLSREGASSPMESMANARLLPLLAQIMLLFALLALWRGWPMAPLRAAPTDARRALTEHADALAAHWQRLGAVRLAASRLAQLQLQRHGAAGLRALAARSAADPADADADAFVASVEALSHVEDESAPLDDHERRTLEALWPHPPR